MKKILKNRYIQIGLAIIIGVGIGAIFYPTKTIEETVRLEEAKKYDAKIKTMESLQKTVVEAVQEKFAEYVTSHKNTVKNLEKKVNVLTTENTSLKENSKRKWLKIVKPDGTIVEQEIEETNKEQETQVITSIQQEFKEKIQSIETRYKSVHKTRVAEIKTQHKQEIIKLKEIHTEELKKYNKSKIVKINEKNFRIVAGVDTDKDIYTHATYPLFGPVVFGFGISGNLFGDNFNGSARAGLGIEF